MMIKASIVALVLAIAAAVLCLMVLPDEIRQTSAGSPIPEHPATFEILVANQNDRIAAEFSEGEVVFDVHSETGIGGAELKLLSGQWPERILLRVHTSGLESFKFSYPGTVVAVEVQSSGDRKVIRSAVHNGEDQSAGEDSKFFMPIVRDDREGWIEVQTPADFHELHPDEFRIDWIDFYR